MTAKKLLIAAVMVTCFVEGVRTDVQPGETLPELSPHDEAELKRMGAIVDPADEAKADRADAKAAAAGDLEFQAARSAVLAAEESTQASADSGAETKASAKTGAKAKA